MESGHNGIVVKPDSVEELYGGIREILDSDHRRREIATAGRETVETRFSFATRMEKVVALYRGLGGELARQITLQADIATASDAACITV